MEYVVVRYPVDRPVIVNGLEGGQTNQIIEVDEGTQTFDLGDPRDYTPDERVLQVTGTTVIVPLEILFTPKADTP